LSFCGTLRGQILGGLCRQWQALVKKPNNEAAPLKPRPKGAKPNFQPLRFLFLPYRHTPAKRCLDAENLACPEAKGFNQHFLKEVLIN